MKSLIGLPAPAGGREGMEVGAGTAAKRSYLDPQAGHRKLTGNCTVF